MDRKELTQQKIIAGALLGIIMRTMPQKGLDQLRFTAKNYLTERDRGLFEKFIVRNAPSQGNGPLS